VIVTCVAVLPPTTCATSIGLPFLNNLIVAPWIASAGVVTTVKETEAVFVPALVQTDDDTGVKETAVAQLVDCPKALCPKTPKIATYRSMATFDVIVLTNRVQVSYGLRTLDSRPLAAPFLLLVEVTG
jgi:hypothetical protein